MKFRTTDYQVNGALGIGFEQEGLTVAQARAVLRYLRQIAIGRVVATLITTDMSRYFANMPVILKAARIEGANGARLAGFFLEGPALSPTDGPRGAHPLKFIRAGLTQRELDDLQLAAEGMIKMVAVAPEQKNAFASIEAMVELDIIPAIAHTEAPMETIHAAIAAGARFGVHVWNGSHKMRAKREYPELALLTNRNLGAVGLIPDGHHTLREHAAQALTCGRPVLFTTDMSPAAGLPVGTVTEIFDGLKVEVGADGKVCEQGKEGLAGSGATPVQCLNWLWRNRDFLGIGGPEMIRGFTGAVEELFALDAIDDADDGPAIEFDAEAPEAFKLVD